MKKEHRSIFSYLSIGYVSAALNMGLSLLTIRLFDSNLLGKVAIGRSIFQSYEFSHLGVRFGLDRLLPNCKTSIERDQLFSASYVICLISSLLFVLFWIVFEFQNVFLYSFFYISGVLYALISLFKVYYRSLEVKKKFVQISFFINLLPLVLQVTALLFWGFWGFVVSFLFSYSIIFVISHHWFKIHFRFNKMKIYISAKKLFSIGYLLFLSAVVSYFSSIGDRFFIAEFWSIELLGNFSVIMFVLAIFGLFSVNYAEMIMSKIMQAKSFSYVIKQLGCVVFLTVTLVVLSYYILPYFVMYIIPNYVSFIPQMQIILIAAIPSAGLPILNFYLQAMDKRSLLLFVNIACTIVYFIFLFVLLKKEPDLWSLLRLKVAYFTVVFILTLFASIFVARFQPKKVSRNSAANSLIK